MQMNYGENSGKDDREYEHFLRQKRLINVAVRNLEEISQKRDGGLF